MSKKYGKRGEGAHKLHVVLDCKALYGVGDMARGWEDLPECESAEEDEGACIEDGN